MTTQSNMNSKKIMVSHGQTTHPKEEWKNCPQCLQIQIEYLSAVKKAGGLKKFIAEIEKNL